MHGHNLIAVYNSSSDAERVRDRLISEGIPSSDIRLSGTPATQIAGTSTREEPGFWAWLFGDLPEDEQNVYSSHLRENRAVVSVRVLEERMHSRVIDIMEEFDPIDLEDQAQGGASTSRQAGMAASGLRTGTMAQTGSVTRTGAEEREQVIPVVKEELSVGKRATERRYRVKTYVIEKPVEEQITLRDERVTIERRPVSAAGRDATMPQQREIDIVERHEEPVVEKRGRVAEEVVVRRDVTERQETVRGTVQETKVDVDKEPVTTGAGTPTSPLPRTPPRR